MKTMFFTCGKPGGPVEGQTVFQNDLLKRIFVEFIIVDNVNENCNKPDRSFSHDYVEGEIDRGSNQWVFGNKLTIIYSTAQ